MMMADKGGSRVGEEKFTVFRYVWRKKKYSGLDDGEVVHEG